MSRYKHGLIFNFQHHLRRHDPNGVFAGVDHHRLLTHVVKFLTEDVYDKHMGKELLNEMEYLIGKLYDQEIIPDFLIDQHPSYLTVCHVLYSTCESIVELFEDVRFFKKIQFYREEPIVIKNSQSTFTIVLKEIR